MNNLLRFLRGHAPDVTALSARLDGQLDASAAARLDQHIASCDTCRVASEGLRATRDALRALPEMAAPRSFRLRAADVERAQAAPPGQRIDPLRWAPALGALAVVVFVVVLAIDLRSNDRGSTSSSAVRQTTHVDSNDSGGLAASKSAGDARPTPAAGIAAPDLGPSATSADRALQPPNGAPPAPGPAGVGSATPSPASPASEQYNNATTAAPSTAQEATPRDVSATAAAADEGGRNNSALLRVIEVIAGAMALAAIAALIVGRRRGDRV